MNGFTTTLLSSPTDPGDRTDRRRLIAGRRRRGMILGWIALILSLGAIVTMMLGDPYAITAPLALLGALLGWWVLKRVDESQPAALAANSLGLCALMLWVMIDLIVWYGVGYHFSLIELIRRAAE